MKLEYLKVGRLYRVKQGRKLLNLRLKEIQTLEGVGTDLYELKITVTNRQLWMLDEAIGKGYVIKDLSSILDEIMPKPKPNDLVKIVKGTMLKSLGSVTLYRVKETGVDQEANRPTVTIYGPFKNYIVWMDDVRVYEGPNVDPETLLSKESKKLGQMPNRFLPGPAVGRSRLASFLKTNKAERGSMSGEEKKTKEDLEKEKRQEELDKQKEDYAAQQHSTGKPSRKELYEQGTEILRNAKKGKDASSSATTQERSSSSTETPISTDNTSSRPSSQKHATSTMQRPINPKNYGTLGSRQPKGRRQKLKDAIKKNSKTSEEGRNGWKSSEGEDSSDPTDAEESAQSTETDTHQDVSTVSDSSDGSNDDVGSSETPEHLRDVSVPMNGSAIHESYFNEHIPESRKRLTELKNGKLRMKKR